MPYIPIPILFAAAECGIELNPKTLDRVEAEAVCPFCFSKRHASHLALNTQFDVFYCYKCGAKGNSVTLYARCHGVDNKTAFQHLFHGGGYGTSYEYRPPPPEESHMAPAALRHDVYFDMLSMLSLESKHIFDLQRRGFSGFAIKDRMYRSLPGDWRTRKQIARELSRHYDLHGVPGFFTKDGEWNLAGKAGLLVPVCTREGYIQGLQIRLDGAQKNKYRWLSSNPKYGYENGTGAKSWVHVAGDTGQATAYVTEGGLKGDAASHLSGGLLFVCVPGLGNIAYLAASIAGLGVTRTLGCYDMDVNANEQARAAQIQMETEISMKLGLECPPVKWNPQFKGVDDYWLARRTWERNQKQNNNLQAA